MSSASPLQKYHYRRRLPHIQKSHADLFVTFCTGARLPLSEAARDLVLQHCLREGGVDGAAPAPLPLAKGRFSPAKIPAPRILLHAVVVMPDHVHLLLAPLRNEDGWPFPLVDILQCLKGATAHRINRLLYRAGPVWEEDSFDHVLRSDESLKDKCEYLRQNPVRAGLVEKPEDYRWLWVNPRFIGGLECGAGPGREKPIATLCRTDEKKTIE
jgi:REP element-mobilizing transposase RayT